MNVLYWKGKMWLTMARALEIPLFLAGEAAALCHHIFTALTVLCIHCQGKALSCRNRLVEHTLPTTQQTYRWN